MIQSKRRQTILADENSAKYTAIKKEKVNNEKVKN
jgi:hypothetical protein